MRYYELNVFYSNIYVIILIQYLAGMRVRTSWWRYISVVSTIQGACVSIVYLRQRLSTVDAIVVAVSIRVVWRSYIINVICSCVDVVVPVSVFQIIDILTESKITNCRIVFRDEVWVYWYYFNVLEYNETIIRIFSPILTCAIS